MVAAMSSSLLKTAFVGQKLAANKARTTPAAARQVQTSAVLQKSWLPGSATPEYLDGSLPGTFGFDPLGLGAQPDALNWYAQAELVHGRFAMLGAAGVLAPELLHKLGTGGPAAATPWYEAGKFDYFAPASTLFAVQLFLFAWVEIRRYQDFQKPGSTNVDPIFSGNKLPDGNEVGYPGGIFDPAGMASPETKLKEIKNGRLAMLAYAGFIAQHITTGTTPLANLGAHLSDPWGINVFSNELARAGY